MLEGSVRKNLTQEMLTQQFEAELKIFRLEQEEISFSLFAGDKECDLRLCWNDGLMSLGEYAQGSCFCWQIPIAWECYTWSPQQLELSKESSVRKYKRKKYSFSASKIQDEISMPGELMFLWQSFPDISGIIFAW